MNNQTDTLRTIARRAAAIIAAVSSLLICSCTTASYGNKFAADPQVPDQYRFKIYVGGFQYAPPERQAEQRIKEFMAGKSYKSYKIVDERYNFVPSYYEFTVVFSR
jgi:hypothetical protein